MKNILIILILFTFFIRNAVAQELIKPPLPELDSTYMTDSLLIPEMSLSNQIIPFQDYSFSLESQNLTIPKFDFNEHLLNMKQDYSYFIFNPEGKSNITIPYSLMPFTNSAAIFSQAAYKLSDKFTIGGNSFGAKSIFSSPFPNQGMNNFDVRGASMFLEYKISDKVKIQTRVNVSNQRY